MHVSVLVYKITVTCFPADMQYASSALITLSDIYVVDNVM